MSIFCYVTCHFSSTPEVHLYQEDSANHLKTAPKKEKQRWVDIEWWFFLNLLTRPFGWILHKIGAHLTWMKHQVFACCTPEVESRYLWNPWECLNSYFIKNQPNYCCQSLQEKSLKNIHLLMGLSTILWFYLSFEI